MECFIMAAEVQIQTVSVWEINATYKSKGKMWIWKNENGGKRVSCWGYSSTIVLNF